MISTAVWQSTACGADDEGLDASLQVARRHHVVVSRPPEVLASSKFQDAIEVRTRLPDCRSNGSTALWSRVWRTADGFRGGGIGGAIVGNDHLEVAERLRADRFESLGEIVLPVVDRNTDADSEVPDRLEQRSPRSRPTRCRPRPCTLSVGVARCRSASKCTGPIPATSDEFDVTSFTTHLASDLPDVGTGSGELVRGSSSLDRPTPSPIKGEP